MCYINTLRLSFHYSLDLGPGLFIGVLAFTALVIASVSSDAVFRNKAVVGLSPSRLPS